MRMPAIARTIAISRIEKPRARMGARLSIGEREVNLHHFTMSVALPDPVLVPALSDLSAPAGSVLTWVPVAALVTFTVTMQVPMAGGMTAGIVAPESTTPVPLLDIVTVPPTQSVVAPETAGSPVGKVSVNDALKIEVGLKLAGGLKVEDAFGFESV